MAVYLMESFTYTKTTTVPPKVADFLTNEPVYAELLVLCTNFLTLCPNFCSVKNPP